MNGASATSPDAQRCHSPRTAKGVLWQRCTSGRRVLAAHLRHVEGTFRAAGWDVWSGPAPPATKGMPVAVLDDPWLEPLPVVAAYLAAARGGAGLWRVPRVSGLAGEQGWSPSHLPVTMRDYERVVLVGRRRAAVHAGAPLWCGFAVASAVDAAVLLQAGWPPAQDRVALIPGARLFRYDDPANHARNELVRWIEATSGTVVDVGCGQGRLGEQLCRLGRRVVGIEPEWASARKASLVLDVVLPLPAEEGLAALRPPVGCFVFADVLEHMTDPASILSRAARLLDTHGRMVVSIPNAAWAPVLRALAGGRWDATLAGVQARDHAFFTTPLSFARLCRECGLEVETLEPLGSRLPVSLRVWAWVMARWVGGDPAHLLSAQWVVVLKRA